MAAAHENPYQWLQVLERLARRQAKGLPRQEKIQEIWRGIAFRLDDIFLVTPITEIREILTCPRTLARVPGAKPWVRGIANIRGLLMPVVDLQLCLGGGKPIIVENRTRLLIINQTGVTSGVLVDEVMGIKHFPENERAKETGSKEKWYAPYTRGAFKEAEMNWMIFDMHAVSKSRAFLDAAT